MGICDGSGHLQRLIPVLWNTLKDEEMKQPETGLISLIS